MSKKYDILIIGHASYPQGVKKFLSFFGLPEQAIMALNVDESHTYDEFYKKLKTTLATNQDLIVFADISGGSPQKAAIEIIGEVGNNNQYVISSVSMSVILDVAMKATLIGNDNILDDVIVPAINGSLKTIMCTQKDQIIDHLPAPDEAASDQADDQGGI